MSETPTERVLFKRYDEVNVYFRTTWDLYLKFYTVFLTFDIAALAWVSNNHLETRLRWPVAISFISQNILVAITSARMVYYSKVAPKKIKDILGQLADIAAWRHETIDKDRVLGVDIPSSIAIWGGIANCAGTSMLALLWVLWWTFSPDPSAPH